MTTTTRPAIIFGCHSDGTIILGKAFWDKYHYWADGPCSDTENYYNDITRIMQQTGCDEICESLFGVYTPEELEKCAAVFAANGFQFLHEPELDGQCSNTMAVYLNRLDASKKSIK